MTSPQMRLVLWIMLGIVLLLVNSGCEKPESAAADSEHDGHSHAEGDGHDHGAEHAHADEIVLTANAIEQSGIKVDSAQLWQLRPTFVVPARVAFSSEAMAHVGSPLPGRIVELKVRLGSDVGVGDPLVVVESPELGSAQSDFLIKRTAAESAAPAVDLAKSAWDRARTLFESTQGITLTEVQRREAEHRAAIAALKSAQTEAMAAENHLHLLGMTQEQVESLIATGEVNPRFTIVAPIAGQVVQREVTLGELVRPEREALLVLADTDTLWVLADVPEARLPETRLDAKAWINAGSLDVHRHEGIVSNIAPMIDWRTRTATVRVVVQCDDKSLKPGMFVQVEIVGTPRDGEEAAPVGAVPEAGLQTVEGSPAVFVPVPNEANTFAKRAVSIGKTVGGLVPIHSGLVEGEQFVSAGSFILKAELGKSTAEHSH